MTAAIRATELKDLAALAQFLVRAYQFDPSDPHADPKFLEWKYLAATPAWEGSSSYLLERNGQITAHCGVYPVTFRLPDGTTVKSVTLTDWAADPSSPGAGVSLYRRLMEMAPTAFVIGGAPATRQILPRIGFRPAGEILTYSAWLRPWQEFQARPRTGRSALRLLHAVTHPAKNRSQASAGWDFVPVNQFDDSVLPLLNAKRAWTVCQRTVTDLNHLMKCPSLDMQGFLLRSQGELIGYFLMGRAQWESRLLDVVVDSEDLNDWNRASTIITQAAKGDPEACRIRAQASFPMLSQALAWNGYWRQHQEPLVIHDPTQTLDQAFPASFQLCDGDSGY